MTLFQAAYEINEKLQKDQKFKKFMSEDKQTLYLVFYEYDLPSVTYAFDKLTYSEIKIILSAYGQ